MSLLAAAGLLLSVQGRGATASAATAAGSPSPAPTATAASSDLTPATAMRAFSAYVTAEHVAVADKNEMLALSLVSDAEYDLTVAAFHLAGNGPLPKYDYGKPTLYVPKLTTFPHWFMAVVSRKPAGGPRSSARTVVLAFEQPNADGQWALDGSVVLAPGTPPLHVAVDGSGYATPLATFDQTLKASPNVVGALQAAVVDSGPASPSATVVAAGPQTTGLYQANVTAEHHAAARHESYQWEMFGVRAPVFTMRTTGGGALVFYTMHMDTTTQVSDTTADTRGTHVPPIPIPHEFRGLLPLHQHPVHKKLGTEETLQYLALVPSGSAHAAKIRVIGVGGGPTSATASSP